MKWSRSRPRREGWYWCLSYGKEPMLVKIYKNCGRLFAKDAYVKQLLTDYIRFTIVRMYWYGPVDTPFPDFSGLDRSDLNRD